MNAPNPSEPEQDNLAIRRTFAAEAVRAIASGAIETALATFAVLIAVNRFESGPLTKSLLLACPALGLLGTLVIVPLAVRAGLTASRAAAGISLVSLGGFLIAALGAQRETVFVLGMIIGIGVLTMAIPLQTHYLRANYPVGRRGRLFSVTIFLRALTTMVMSWVFGVYLDADFSRYPMLLWCMAGASAVVVACYLCVPSTTLRDAAERRHGLLESVHVSRDDRVFVRVLMAMMILGLGVLSANALRVDFLANPEHGLALDVKTVSIITGIIPSIVRLGSTFFWGLLFDRMNFFILRGLINLVFLVGILLHFVWADVTLIMIGAALFGLARGGGEIMFNLWVTKVAPFDRIADYMSVHTFLAGIRLLLAPFLGFFLVTWVSVSLMVAVSASLALASIGFVIWAARAAREDVDFGRRLG